MGYALDEALGGMRRSPLLTALSAAMIALSLFVFGLFGIVTHNIRVVIEGIEERVEIVAYLRDDAGTEAIHAARDELLLAPQVLEVRYVSQEEALRVARRTLPEFRAVFEDLEVNPLPASIEIQLRPGYRTPDRVAEVADRLAKLPFVEEVEYGRDWLELIFLLRRIAAVTALVLGIAFFSVAALIVGAAVRMSIFARREEIAIMRLVGATRGFVRRPFLLEGLVTGLLGAALALGLTFVAYRIMWQTVVELQWLPTIWTAGGILGGGLLGLLAAGLAVRHYLEEL